MAKSEQVLDQKATKISDDFMMVEQIDNLPVVVLPKTVLFPNNTLPLTNLDVLSRDDQKAAKAGKLTLGIVTDLDNQTDSGDARNISAYGTEAIVSGLVKLANGKICVIVKGTRRFAIRSLRATKKGHICDVTIAEDLDAPQTISDLAASTTLKNLIQQILKLHPMIDHDAITTLYAADDAKLLCDIIVQQLSLSLEEKLHILSTFKFVDRLKLVLRALSREIDLLKLSLKIQEDMQGEIHEGVRRNFLKEQLAAIKRELGEDESTELEVDEIARALESANLPEAVRTPVFQELKRARSMHQSSPEYSLSMTYLDWVRMLPWDEPSRPGSTQELQIDLDDARKTLDDDHFGIVDVKQRIIEYLAVIKHRGHSRGEILLLNGPPGVGKTSLGKSIAATLNRPFKRIALGGVKDEAEIRGHRKTYVGAMPGKIIQAIKECGSADCVLLLDEVDKAGSIGTSDICSALLEVLDPEQNGKFVDHYLNFPFDLSRVLFLATSNDASSVPSALRDRMEVIDVHSYSEHEKVEIAKRHMLPKIRRELDIPLRSFSLSRKTIRTITALYTREAGVRNLNRQLQKIGRKIVTSLVSDADSKIEKVDEHSLVRFLGNPKFPEEPLSGRLPAGVAVGLAYTSFGGDVLLIESKTSTLSESQPRLLLTGRLGDVMQESAQTVFSFIRSGWLTFGLSEESYGKTLLHVHVPDGATPKDGPSAGVALACSMLSALTGKAVPATIAMTGEATLRGAVLPVGGIKEKVLAALRHRKKTLILPRQNLVDLNEIDPNLLRRLRIFPVENLWQALGIVKLLSPKQNQVAQMPRPIDPASYTTGLPT